jgi:LysM repeat protein
MTLKGTDISGWQDANPNFDGLDFVISKATEGQGYVNPNHSPQTAKARAEGKLIGHYHFLDGSTPEAQAQYFFANCGWLPGEILAADYEAPFADTPGAMETLRRFVVELTRLSGFPCEIYADSSHVTTQDFSPVASLGCGLWGAAYNGTGFGDTGAFAFVSIWQNADTNQTGGDSDYFYGDATAWHKYGTPQGAAPVPTIADVPTPPPAVPDNVYVVQPGDTYSGIAQAHGLELAELEAANPGVNYDVIHPGDYVTIPEHAPVQPEPAPATPTVSQCVVTEGDTLGGIAQQFGVPLDEILSRNPGITNPDVIYPGQVINL